MKEEGCVLFGGEGTRMGWFCLSGEDGVGKPLLLRVLLFNHLFYYKNIYILEVTITFLSLFLFIYLFIYFILFHELLHRILGCIGFFFFNCFISHICIFFLESSQPIEKAC